MSLFFIYFIVIFLSFFVILSKNPVQSVLFLILVYLFIGYLFLLLGAEFLGILVFIIYIGAISILFLFVIMLLNLRVVELFNTFFNYFPVGSFLGVFFFLEVYALFITNFSSNLDSFFFSPLVCWHDLVMQKPNLYLFGIVLYNYNWFLIIIASVILLVAMLGSIIFTTDDMIIKGEDTYTDIKKDISVLKFC